jgi:hypothetical protein
MSRHSSKYCGFAFKNLQMCSDNPTMARRVTCQWMACVLVLAVCGWHGAFAAELPSADAEAEEDLPDINHVRAFAAAGRAGSQTQLADFYLASADFTNAVLWYRRAADQGHVPAQLSLAGCLMSGRGTVRNPAEAARLLRLAADTIESSGATGRLARATLPETVRAGQAHPAVPQLPQPPTGNAVGSTNSPPASAAMTTRLTTTGLTNLPRVQRVEALLAVEPTLQAQPASPPSSAPR